MYRDTLRPGLAAQGLLGLHLPEALGGHGYGLPELAVATEGLGRAMVPGGFLPTLTFLMSTLASGSKGTLIVDSVSNIGPHYARTLREWRRRFPAAA